MANVGIYTGLLKGGRLQIYVRSESRKLFGRAIRTLSRIPVISYNKKRKYHESTIYYYDFIKELVINNGWNFFFTKKLKRYYRKFKEKLERVKEARKDKTFQSKYWTKDPENQILSFQAQAVNVCYEAKKYLIGDDMGLGKTPEALGVMCKAFEDGYKRTLIVVLNRLKFQWRNEIEKFTTFRESNGDISIVDSTVGIKCEKGIKLNLRSRECKNCKSKKKCKRLRDDPRRRRKYQFSKGKIVICNYEILDRSLEIIKKSGFDIFILDEASKMKNRSTKLTKALLKIRRELRHNAICIPMSGTFIENRLEELWAPFYFTDPRILGEFYNFKNHYLIFDYWGNTVGYKNEKKLKKIIKDHIIRRPIEKVWKDRPPLISVVRTCEMTMMQRSIYDDAREGILKQLNDLASQKKINRADILPLMNYLIQICDTTETQDPSIRESGKIDVLKDIIENEIHPRHKVVIFSFYANKVIPILKRELKSFGKSVTVVGGLKPKIFEKRKSKFIENENIRFAICSDSMAYGQNMQVASYVINFDLLWNPAKMEQRLRRVYRIGQKKPVTVIDLVTTNTLEDKMLEVLGERRELFDKILGAKAKKTKKPSVDQLLGILRN